MSTFAEGSTADVTESFQTLPIELVLRIIDILALDLRDSEPAHARSLFLVSRAVRRNLLPLLYEVHSTLVKTRYEFKGWDGRQYKNPALSFFSWLLCTPSAQPRHYIKDLIFCNELYFRWSELQQDITFDDGQRKPRPWSINNLIVLEPWDAQQLSHAGLRPRTAQKLDLFGSYNISFGALTARDLITSTEELWVNNPKTRCYIRLCAQPAYDSLDPTQEEYWQATPGSWDRALLYQDLDPLRNYCVLELPEEKRGIFIFIDVGSSDGFGDPSIALLDEIALILENDSVVSLHVVLVYPRGEKDIVISGVVEKLQAHCAARTHGRLWVARSSTDRKLLVQNPHLEMARAFQQGIDPWAMGSRVSEFMTEGRLDE